MRRLRRTLLLGLLGLLAATGGPNTAVAYNGLPNDLSQFRWTGSYSSQWDWELQTRCFFEETLSGKCRETYSGSLSASQLKFSGSLGGTDVATQVYGGQLVLDAAAERFDTCNLDEASYGKVGTRRELWQGGRAVLWDGVSFFPSAFGISSTPEGFVLVPDRFLAPATYTDYCVPDGEPPIVHDGSKLQQVGGYAQESLLSPPDVRLTEDTDPDPRHLVGTMTWTKGQLPVGTELPPERLNESRVGRYSFSVRYDLRLVPAPATKDTPVAVSFDGPGRVDGLPSGACRVRFHDDPKCPEAVIAAGGSLRLTARGFANGAFLNWQGCDAVSGSVCTVRATKEGKSRRPKVSFDPMRSYAPRAFFDDGQAQAPGVPSDGPEDYFPGDPAAFLERAELRLFLPPYTSVCGQRGKGGGFRSERRKLVASPSQLTSAKLRRGYWKYNICILGRGGQTLRQAKISSSQLTAPAAKDDRGKKPKGSRAGFYLSIPGGGSQVTKAFLHGRSVSGTTGPKMPVQFQNARHIVYWFFFPYNDRDGDRHQGDWEHLVVRLDSRNLASQVAYYYHLCQPTILGVPAVTFEDETHPLAFVAGGGHGIWPTSGVTTFACLKGLYDTRGRGTAWDTWRSGLVTAKQQEWWDLGVGWGRDGGIGWGPVGPGPRKSGSVPDGW